MQSSFHIIISIWMLLATMPFSITMHYCKGANTNICSTEMNCCNDFKDFVSSGNTEIEKTQENLNCPIDCCADLSITSIPKEQFKNNPTDDLKNMMDFVAILNSTLSYKAQQNIFLAKINKTSPLLVKKATIFNQCFLC